MDLEADIFPERENKQVYMYLNPQTPSAVRDVVSLGERIRDARRAQGLTLTQAAMLCGVGVRFLSELENGKRTAEVGKVLHVLHSLGFDLHATPRATVRNARK